MNEGDCDRLCAKTHPFKQSFTANVFTLLSLKYRLRLANFVLYSNNNNINNNNISNKTSGGFDNKIDCSD